MRNMITNALNPELTNCSSVLDDCSVEVPQELNLIPPTVKGIAYSMFGLNALLVIVGGIWLRVHWDSNAVKYRCVTFLLVLWAESHFLNALFFQSTWVPCPSAYWLLG